MVLSGAWLYVIASYAIVFFGLKWFTRNMRHEPKEFHLLSGLLWLMSPLLPPVLIIVGVAWGVGLIITGSKQ